MKDRLPPRRRKVIYNNTLFHFLSTGSPAVLGDEDDVELDDDNDDAIDLNYISESQKQKQKIEEHMMNWRMSYGQAQDLPPPNYDKEVSLNHIPLLTNGQVISFP